MSIQARIQQWHSEGSISTAQQTQLTTLVRQDPFSLFTELNTLLYLGVLAFILGLGWTVSTFAHQLGDTLILTLLTALLAAALWFCFSRAPAFAKAQTPAPSLLFDYILYLACLVWTIELAFLEQRFHLLTGQWSVYLLATALAFFALAYRLDNRFVLSLALTSLAAWFGFTLSTLPFSDIAHDRHNALLFSLLVATAAIALHLLRIKPHFLATYLNLIANITFIAILSGVFDSDHDPKWSLALLLACAAALAWAIARRQFAFVAYATLYGYIGVTYLLFRTASLNDFTGITLYFVVTATAIIALLVLVARAFGRTQ